MLRGCIPGKSRRSSSSVRTKQCTPAPIETDLTRVSAGSVGNIAVWRATVRNDFVGLSASCSRGCACGEVARSFGCVGREMGPLIMQDVRELSRKASRASTTGSECSAASHASRQHHPSTSRSSSTSSSTDSITAIDNMPVSLHPLDDLHKAYTLHVRLLMYARDLLTSMQSSRDVRASFHSDPVLLPSEYFSSADRDTILSTKISETRCYRDIVEEVLLDKRGHFSCLDILPLVQRTFSLRSEDILSTELSKLQETFHKQYRQASRQAKAAEAILTFGEHSV